MKGRFRTRGMLNRIDAGHEGWRKGGIQERLDAGLEGCRKEEIQEMRDENSVLSWH